MKNNITEVVAILDMSGSMADLADDTIGSFNAMLKEQKEQNHQVLLTTYVFNNEFHMIHDRQSLETVSNLTAADYRPSGCTALLDTMGEAINHISTIYRYSREEDIPQHTLFFITTDGMENASHTYSDTQIRKMVDAGKEKGWEFIYLASNIDAVETSEKYGIPKRNAVDYHPDATGTQFAFRACSRIMDIMSADENINDDESWRSDIDWDFKNRN